MYISASTKIVTILGTLVNTAGGIGIVYDYEESKPTKFPCAIVVPKGGDEDEIDNQSDELRMTFTVRVTDNGGDNSVRQTSETRMKTLCDSILVALRSSANVTLGGTSIRTRPFQISWGWVDAPSPMRFFEIEVQVTECVNI